MDQPPTYLPESAGGLMQTNIPTAYPEDSVSSLLKRLAAEVWDDIHLTYIISDNKELLGLVSIDKLLAAKPEEKLERVMRPPKITVKPNVDQEKVVIEALRNNLKHVPVVDDDNHFLGVILADQIIDILHSEHLEDFLRSSGIRGKGSQIIKLATSAIPQLIQARLPWLIVGLLVGFAVSLISSKFEDALKSNIALVYFIPLIAYMSDAIGTQSETIFIRSMTVLKLNALSYIIKELLVGMIIGSILGLFTGFFGFMLSGSWIIGIIVGISLFLSMSVAAVLAILTPLAFKFLGKDPAIGSGPFTTALQDLISLTVYFVVAILFLKSF